MTDTTDHYDTDDPEADVITLRLPVWMVRQLRGKAIEDKHLAKTTAGREDAEHIEMVLAHALDDAGDTDQ